MANEPISGQTFEVECLFCGGLTPGPVLTGVRRWNLAQGVIEESEFRVSVIRCERCGKEAPYSSAQVIRNGETPKAKRTAA